MSNKLVLWSVNDMFGDERLNETQKRVTYHGGCGRLYFRPKGDLVYDIIFSPEVKNASVLSGSPAIRYDTTLRGVSNIENCTKNNPLLFCNPKGFCVSFAYGDNIPPTGNVAFTYKTADLSAHAKLKLAKYNEIVIDHGVVSLNYKTGAVGVVEKLLGG